MNGLFVHSHIFSKNGDNYYSEGKLTYKMWYERYLKYLDKLTVAGRVTYTKNTSNLNIASGERVNFVELPSVNTLKNRRKNKNHVLNLLTEVIKTHNIDVIIARLPSAHGSLAIKVAKKLDIKLVVEMVGDPFNALWYHGSPLGKMYAPISYINYKKLFRDLDNIIFVTKYYLQNRYKKNAEQYHTTNISNVDLIDTSKFNIGTRLLDNELVEKKPIKIATIGSYSSKYKGFETAIKALKKLREKNYDIHLYILGSGSNERYLNLIKNLQSEEYIHFIPPIQGGQKIIEWLKEFDFYIQPSLTEGLPRALIEAMSIGLPSVATDVGGIPELLDRSMQIKVNDASGLANIIEKLIYDKNKYNEQVIANFATSKEYSKHNLENKRDKFWEKLLEDNYE